GARGTNAGPGAPMGRPPVGVAVGARRSPCIQPADQWVAAPRAPTVPCPGRTGLDGDRSGVVCPARAGGKRPGGRGTEQERFRLLRRVILPIGHTATTTSPLAAVAGGSGTHGNRRSPRLALHQKGPAGPVTC